MEVEFTDGSSFHLSAEFLRVHSPAADSKIISVSGEKVIFCYVVYFLSLHDTLDLMKRLVYGL